MRVVFRPEARNEVLEAQRWYEARLAGLGREFAEVVEAAITAAAGNPGSFPNADGDLRRVTLRRFPYALFFRIRDGDLLVVACHHYRRGPTAWAKRLAREPRPAYRVQPVRLGPKRTDLDNVSEVLAELEGDRHR